jgi:hypothetical protein
MKKTSLPPFESRSLTAPLYCLSTRDATRVSLLAAEGHRRPLPPTAEQIEITPLLTLERL